MVENKLFKESDLSLEVVILLFAGMAMLTLGILLFPVYAGSLPYYENGLFGLLLVILALQIVFMGKTPFGDMQRSRITAWGGTSIAALGIVTCFVPGILGSLPRVILSFALGAGGLVLFLQMLFTQNRYRLWRTYGGIFNHLIVACGAVYLCQTFIAILIFKPSIFNAPLTISAVLAYAFALTYLACVLQIINRHHPSKPEEPSSDGGLSLNNATLLLMGVFMLILGLLLIPVDLGLLPFSGSAQLGLLMVLFAIQMLALGNTPIGPFPRTWLIIFLGFIFGIIGVISSIVPGILVVPLTLIVGLLNVAGGTIGIVKVILPFFRQEKTSEPMPVLLIKINSAVIIMNFLSMLFGITMLFSGLVSGLVLGIILAGNGCVLLYLLSQLLFIERITIQSISER